MRRWTWSGCVLSTLVSLMIYVSGTVPTLEELSSALFDSVSFNVSHVTLDSDTGRLYVGAVNRLYELSPALERLHEVVTGPYPDNPMCPPPPEPCRCTVISCRGGTDRFPIDGVTKTLLIDYNARQLIHCTNLFQGNCSKYGLGDMSRRNASASWNMIVPNDEMSSVVMFIAPGPVSSSLSHPPPSGSGGAPSATITGPNILYVAATRSTKGLPAYKDLIPAVCMRNIDNFNLFSSDFLTPSRVYIEAQQRDTFRVDYVYGFSSLQFSYFLTVQRAATDATAAEDLVTRVARVCQRNPAVTYTYAEIPLECRRGSRVYGVLRAATVVRVGAQLARSLGLPDEAPATDNDDVLVGVFADLSAVAAAGGSSSVAHALCVYPVLAVRRKFTETIQECFNGVGNTGPEHVIVPQPCIKTPFPIDDSYCGERDMNHPIHGTDPVWQEAALTWTSTRVSTVAVTSTGRHTVAFVGTVDGQLKKIVIESDRTALQYASFFVHAQKPINGSIVFDLPHEHLYLATLTKVLRIPVQHCSTFTSCTDCLTSHDPYCGWCTLESKCSIKAECRNSNDHSRWLPYSYASCPRILLVEPRHVQKLPTSASAADTSSIRVTVQSLPAAAHNSTYECAFSGYGVTRSTVVRRVEPINNVNTTLLCSTPAFNLLPPFPTGIDHIDMQLSVRLSGTADFLFTNFTFYDCSVHTSCTKCTDSEYPCKWCIRHHVCTNHATSSETCEDDIMVTGRQLPGITDHPGPATCPRIENKVDSSVILISSGKVEAILVKPVNIKDFQKAFKCHFNFDGGIDTDGVLTVDSEGQRIIQCAEVQFVYAGHTSLMNVPFSIMWLNGNRYNDLDNPSNVQVRMFKCSAMATTCGGCRRTDPVYRCHWDAASNRCCAFSECTGPFSLDDICTNPALFSIVPMAGPPAGGTKVTVTGENLGIGVTDTYISVGGQECIINHVDPFISYVCTTQPLRDIASTSVPVSVTIRGQELSLTARSADNFTFVDPMVTGFQPAVGPVSGGSRLTVIGQHLDIGSHVTTVLTNGENATVHCRLHGNRLPDSVVCITGASTKPAVMNYLAVSIDSARVNFAGQFSFVPDPVIERVTPFKTIISGGVPLSVHGRHLASVSEPKIVVYVDNWQFTSPCVTSNDTVMVCRTPDLRSADVVRNISTNTHLAVLHYGFLMDDVESVLDMSSQLPTGYFLDVYPDPEFDGFVNGVKQMFQPRNDYLTINGRHLNLVLSESDISVTIGSEDCHVTSMSATQLTCKPSFDDVGGISRATLDSKPVVAVRLLTGRNISYVIGELMYEGASRPFKFSFTIIAALVGISVFVISVIVCVLVAYKRKSRESSQVMKRMQSQMDVLEIRVAKECKEAFAELQTDMTEIAGEISGASGIPFRGYSSFCMSVLFPGASADYHPVIRGMEVDEGMSRGLQQFNILLGFKTFVLLFIRTLEREKEFNVRDKVCVASLLSAALQNRMEYHTDVLKTLLAELIERAMDCGNHPKLLLRRTDSVAEKMLTNWFTFLLYRFLQECAGEPLFMLFRAIKQQADKGPVDMVTGEARYSLSEDKLIRQQIEYKQLTVRLTDPDGQQEHHVKVLDCDSITQVKEKILDAIYKNTPFSHRPAKEDLDLEWHTGTRSRMILKDEDLTMVRRSEVGFKRVNTLAHYRVADGAVMSLVPRHSSTSCYDLSSATDRSSFQHRYEEYFAGTPASLTRSLSPNSVNNTNDIDIGSRSYHLVKPQDCDTHRDCERGSKMVSEVYLTRLLTTKVAVQQFVDDLLETIFSTTNRECALPLAVKYMFDFLDDQAILHEISDPEVVHTWKSNILPLRFWVNVIKNPDFVFDVYKSNIVDSCLSVVAQTFMDCCSMSEHKLGKDSPSSKLLYAKDIPKYRKWVDRYYQDIKTMPAISDQDMNAMLAEESRLHQHEFALNSAVYQLYLFADRYYETLMGVLSEDEFARNYQLASKLQKVHLLMRVRV